MIAYEQLQIRNLVKNHHLAKSIHDAGWGTFISWVKAYGLMHNVPIIAVAPHFTSQACSACGAMVKKSLSVRTHICTSCGVVLDRDHNAALNILAKALERTLGHRETSSSEENASGQTASDSYTQTGYEQSGLDEGRTPAPLGRGVSEQTIGDTLGIGGIFRALRTVPVMLEMCRDMVTIQRPLDLND